jgi:hypothetical protein
VPGVDSGARVELHDVSSDDPNRYLAAFVGGLGRVSKFISQQKETIGTCEF